MNSNGTLALIWARFFCKNQTERNTVGSYCTSLSTFSWPDVTHFDSLSTFVSCSRDYQLASSVIFSFPFSRPLLLAHWNSTIVATQHYRTRQLPGLSLSVILIELWKGAEDRKGDQMSFLIFPHHHFFCPCPQALFILFGFHFVRFISIRVLLAVIGDPCFSHKLPSGNRIP